MHKIFKNIFNNSLLKSAGLYTVTSVINSAIPFFLLPVLTRYLSPSDFGIVSMFGVLVSLVAPFTGLSIHGSISRMYYEKETIDIREYIANCIYILISSTLLVSIIFFLFSEIISKATSVPTQLLWMVIVFSFCQFITLIVLTLWQVQVKPLQYGIYQISQTTFNLILSLFFIVVLGFNWKGRIYAQLITLLVFCIIGLTILVKNKWLKFNYNPSYIKNALSFGIPLIPHALGAIIMTMTDRVFITNMVGIEATGLYSVGFQIGMIISILSASFNQAYVPWLFSKLKEGIFATKVKIVKLTYVYFIIIIILAISLSILAPWFLNFFVGEKFTQSSIYVVWIAIGYAFNGMYLMVTNYIFYAQKTAYLAFVTFLSAILNIILNYLFIKKNGAIGAAQATTVIYLFNFILTWILSAKVYKMPWNIFKKNLTV